MKRLVTMMLVAAFTFALAAQASALEVNVKGNFHFSFRWTDNMGSADAAPFREAAEDNFAARQRMRFQVDFVASENLRGVLYLHSGNLFWGNDSQGGALDTTKNTLKVRHAYIDWNVPDTGLNVKMGLQQIANPAFAAGSVFVNDAMAGVTISNEFNENVAATLGWYRLYNGSQVKDAVDMFMLSVPLTFDGFKITPWGEYTFIGREAGMIYQNGIQVPFTADQLTYMGISAGDLTPDYDEKGKMWHAGIATEFNPIDPLTIGFDFIYGAAERGDNARVKTDGFYAAMKAKYDVGFGKVMGGLWYASGSDEDDILENAEFGTMPSMVGSTNGDPGFDMTGLGFWGNYGPLAGAGIISQNGMGTWGVMLGLENFSFVTDLTHTVRVAYYEGTNEDGFGRAAWGHSNGVILTEKDSAFEVNFDSKYQIAKGFSVTLDTGVVFMDWENDWEDINDGFNRMGVGEKLDDVMWRVVFGVQYAF